MLLIPAFLRTPPAIPYQGEPASHHAQFQYWRYRILGSMTGGYAIFYFCRKNLSAAFPVFSEATGITKTDMGLILAAHGLVYGLSKFSSGMLADKSNGRYFMALGLAMSALMNIGFGLAHLQWVFGLFWILNGLFQGAGVPPCARLLTQWFHKRESGFAWGIWNASHQIGGACILVLAAYLAQNYGWQSAFLVPAGIALTVAGLLMFLLRDGPESLGLPSIFEIKGEQEPASQTGSTENIWQVLVRYVIKHPVIWVVCFANLFVYIVRIGFLDWGVTFLKQGRGLELQTASYLVAVFEVAGLLGAFASGWISDRFSRGRRGPTAIVFMALLVLSLAIFWQLPVSNLWLLGALMFLIGFFVYGPQMLVAVVAARVAGRQGAGTAVGMTGLFGYLGYILSVMISGIIADSVYKWDGAFLFFLVAGGIGLLLFFVAARFWEREQA